MYLRPCLQGRGGLEKRLVAVRLRLKKFGRRHKNFFRLNAMDIRRPRDGRVLEELGWYDPGAKEPDKQISLDRERIEYWLSVGAQPSATVRQLLKRHGIGSGK
jgi:small subunit ribosomal protein S16